MEIMMTVRLKLIFFILSIQSVSNHVNDMKNSCVNDNCTTAVFDLSDEIFASTTDNNLENDFSTKDEKGQEKNIEEQLENIGNELELKSSSDNLQDEYLLKLQKTDLLKAPNNTGNEDRRDPGSRLKKEYAVNNELILNKESKKQSAPSQGSKPEVTLIETTTQMNRNTTKDFANSTNSNATKDINQKRLYQGKNHSEICVCDLKVNDCDINCCCDRDCSEHMKKVFTTCVDAADKASLQFCFNSRSIFKNNLQAESIANGLLCVVRNNLHPFVQFREEMIINNVTDFNKRISRKKFFMYSSLKFDSPKMQEIPYKFGDFVWAFSENKTHLFGIVKESINMQCTSKQNIRYLTDYETQCLHLVPDNRDSCIRASHLGMNYFLRDIKLIKSPLLISSKQSSEKVCTNKTCTEITSYVCPEDSDLSSCIKSPARTLLWDNICRNIVSSVEYHIYHNGTDGLKEARAYFTLRTFETESFSQKIRLKFLWAKTPSEFFTRSGNPGYLIGKPIISGRKVYNSNDSMVKKEAIELSYYPEDWLTVVGTNAGICSSSFRRPIGFGENAHFSCFVELDKCDHLKCTDLQDIFFNLLLGNDFDDIKTNNNLNKFVATFGNSEVEETGDWVQVMIDTLPIVSSQVGQVKNSDNLVCRNIVSDLFVDLAYSKIGSFDKPQNKILGVRMHFGSPRTIVYFTKPHHTGFGSSQKVKLSTYVNFIDLTREPHAEFAETPGFEAKLPHDFFYPFFSGIGANSVSFFALFTVLITHSFL